MGPCIHHVHIIHSFIHSFNAVAFLCKGMMQHTVVLYMTYSGIIYDIQWYYIWHTVAFLCKGMMHDIVQASPCTIRVRVRVRARSYSKPAPSCMPEYIDGEIPEYMNESSSTSL